MTAVDVRSGAAAWYVRAYTQPPTTDDDCSARVAGSVHLDLGRSPDDLHALNAGRGIVFARAIPGPTPGTRSTRTLREPALSRDRAGKGYWLVAVRALADGTPDPAAAGAVLVFHSPDLVTFQERGLLVLDDAAIADPHVRPTADGYAVTWRTGAVDEGRSQVTVPELAPAAGAPPREDAARPDPVLRSPARAQACAEGPTAQDRLLRLDDATGRRVERRYGRVHAIAVEAENLAADPDTTVDLSRVRARVRYSDGSVADLPVTWDRPVVPVPAQGGTEEVVIGTVRQRVPPFPFVSRRADPCLFRYEERWYFVATDDTDGDNTRSAGLAIRSAATLEGIATAQDRMLLQVGEGGAAAADLRGCFWAPELHLVGGVLTLFFSPAVGAADWSRVQSHVMRLTPGGDPTDCAAWTVPLPVLQQDGAPLQLDTAHPGISLDMTYAESGGRSYVIWSQRSLDDEDSEPDLWAGTIDPAHPERLTSPPVRLLAPLYGWERNSAPVAEGPFVLRHGGQLWLTYSASGVGPTYATGLLSALDGADLTDPAAWTRHMTPALVSDPAIRQWGPGHNTFVVDEDGQTLLVYHAKSDPAEPERHTGVRAVHWAADGRPLLDMTPKEQVAPELRQVSVRLVPGSRSEQRDDR